MQAKSSQSIADALPWAFSEIMTFAAQFFAHLLL
jgi:hypothetical protein